jgi:DNA polymerase-3 subunit alpha
VSYLLQITTIDPLKYELLFERFLNPERISMPDVDIDFSDERREEVMEYVFEKYGRDKVSKVCTFGTLSAKAALKDVGRAVGVPFSEMNMLTKILPNKPGFKLADTEEFPDFMAMVRSSTLIKKTYDLALKLEGCIRHVSVHACAVIIAKDPLLESCPIQLAPTSAETKITQYPYQQLEALGLLKMDFLGLKNLSILEKAVRMIKKTTGKDVDLATIPIDDKAVFEMISRGETTGVFQFESAGMRRYLKELKPTEFEDLVAMNALYRPGPMEYIPTYIEGKHNPKSVKYMHPVLEPLLKKTYGIAVYQEQILKIAQVFSGFSLGEADLLRKAIGKKIMSVLQQQRQKFIDGAVEKGYDEKIAIKMFDDIIVPFSGYGFNRSHAVCYARIAYETAYLRANYPVEFMAAMMTTDRNNTDRIVIEMNECNTMNIEVLPPALNQSGAYFTVIKDKDEAGEECKKIRFGLSAIKGIGEDSVAQMMTERDANGLFTSLGDFAKRTPVRLVNKKSLEALSFSGALDQFGDRKAIVESIEDLAKYAKEQHEQASSGQLGLFGAADSAQSITEFTLKDHTATKEEMLQWEKESLGLYVSDHPLKEYEDYIKENGRLISSLVEDDIGETITLHGIITEVKKRITKKGDPMAIITIDDMSGFAEMPIFPRQFATIDKNRLVPDQIIKAEAKVNEREGSLNLIANKIEFKTKENLTNTPEKEVPENRNIPQENKKLNITKTIPLYLPEAIPKSNIAEIIHILKQNKAPEDTPGVQIEIHLRGKTKKVPFVVLFSPELKTSLQALL